MKISRSLLAGSALCLLVPASAALAEQAGQRQDPLMLAQAETPEAPAAECPPGTTAAGDGCVPAQSPAVPPAAPPEETAPPEDQDAAPAEPETSPDAEQPSAPVGEEGQQDQQQAPEPSEPEVPVPEERPAPEPEAEPEPAMPEQPPASEEAEPAPAGAGRGEEAPASEPGSPDDSPAVEPPADVAPEASPDEPAEAPGEAPALQQSEPPADVAPEEQPSGPAPIPTPAPDAPRQAPVDQPSGEPATETPAETPPEAAPEAPSDAAPAETGEPAPAGGEQPVESGQSVLPENAAPVLDSQKEQPAGQSGQDSAQPPASEPAGEPAQAGEPAPPPQSDAEAQQLPEPPEQIEQGIRSVIEEEGQRLDLGQTPEDRAMRRSEIFERPREGRVVQQFNDNRTIVEIDNHVYVRGSDYGRLVRQDDAVYYEELRGGRVREVVERRDGSRLVTIRNRYGDVIRRVRVLPDGREVVLVYVPDDRYENMRPFRDPGRDLPPLRLTIPVEEYILDAGRVNDPQAYYAFLAEPPVEPVERLYSIDEVRYSARLRDKVRRIDLDTIQFEFGSAAISDTEIGRLENLANAIIEMLERNPAETFLLEGHTDAVGSETANLALSDRRAESVAVALTNVFGIPPENLVTQGYGEQYLKINTQEPERENRRVAVRRITPLVAPVANR
ncbi:OmpA family protein [Chelativorans composti]|uniref:OmpA family protein n=1 Tax=Chelativorans composti TaxID=768533 RepID=A0ABW5DGT1_9HYPH